MSSEKHTKVSVASMGARGGQWLSGGWLGRREVMADGIRFGRDPRTRRATEGFSAGVRTALH